MSKRSYHEALAHGKQLLTWISEGDEAWGWANTDKPVSPLKEAAQTLETVFQNLIDFEKAYLSGDINLKSMSVDDKNRQLANFVDKFELVIKPVTTQLALLRSCQATRRSLGLV